MKTKLLIILISVFSVLDIVAQTGLYCDDPIGINFIVPDPIGAPNVQASTVIADFSQFETLDQTFCNTGVEKTGVDLWYFFYVSDPNTVVSLTSEFEDVSFTVYTQSEDCSIHYPSYGCSQDQLEFMIEQPEVFLLKFSSSELDGRKFTIQLAPIEAPANNDCDGSLLINQINTDGTCQLHIDETTLGATFSEGESNFALDLWYGFKATSTSHIINTYDFVELFSGFEPTSFSLTYKIYGGDCGEPELIQTIDNPNFGSNVPVTDLAVGGNYFIQVVFDGLFEPINYKLCIQDATPPVNDLKPDATPIVQAPDFKCNFSKSQIGSVSFSTPTDGLDAQCGDLQVNGDIWYKFSASSSKASVRVRSFIEFGAFYNIELYDESNKLLGCSSTELLEVEDIVEGDIYFIRIYAQSPGPVFGVNGAVRVCVFGMPTTTLAGDGEEPGSCTSVETNVVLLNGSQRWKFIKDDKGNILGAIFDSEELGRLAVSYYVHDIDDGIRSDDVGPYLSRNFQITPEKQPSSPIKVRIFCSQAEWNQLRDRDESIVSIVDMGIDKLDGDKCDEQRPNEPLGILGNEEVAFIDEDDPSKGFYIESEVASFSRFFVRSKTTTLPIDFVNAKINKVGSSYTLNWDVELTGGDIATEYKVLGLLESANTFVELGSTLESSYNITSVIERYPYFKVVAIDQYDQSTESEIIPNYEYAKELNLTVYPNPVKEDLKIVVEGIQDANNKSYLTIYSTQGAELFETTLNQNGEVIINDLPLLPGLYILNLTSEGTTVSKQILKM